MMKDILIYGFGGFGHEVACLIDHINRIKPTWNVIGYIDDGVEVGTECKYGKVFSSIGMIRKGCYNICRQFQLLIPMF